MLKKWCEATLKAVYPDCEKCGGSGYAGREGYETTCPDCADARAEIERRLRFAADALRLFGVDVDTGW